MLTKPTAFLLFVALTFVLAGCDDSDGLSSRKPQDYIGEYVFMPLNSDTDGLANRVVLNGDGSAVEFMASGANANSVISRRTKWRLYDFQGHPELVVADRGYKIVSTKDRIRLQINTDLGTFYEKVK